MAPAGVVATCGTPPVAILLAEWTRLLDPVEACVTLLSRCPPPPHEWSNVAAVELPASVITQLRLAARDDDFLAAWAIWTGSEEPISTGCEPLLLGVAALSVIEAASTAAGLRWKRHMIRTRDDGRAKVGAERGVATREATTEARPGRGIVRAH